MSDFRRRFEMLEPPRQEDDDFVEPAKPAELSPPPPKIEVLPPEPKVTVVIESPRPIRGVEAVEELDPFFTEVPDEPFGAIQRPKEARSWLEIWNRCPRWVRWFVYLLLFKALVSGR